MIDIKLLFKRTQLLDAGWEITQESSTLVMFQCVIDNPFSEPNTQITPCLGLRPEDDSLVMKIPDYQWLDESVGGHMRVVFEKANAQYEAIEVAYVAPIPNALKRRIDNVYPFPVN